MVRYLLDENLPRRLKNQLIFHKPSLEVLLVGDNQAPPLGTPDPDILNWLEQNNFMLVSRNRSTMPIHLKDHIANNRHVPGILLIRKEILIGKLIEDLLLIWGASQPDEYRDQIVY
ncbi:MAG: hypothetical protein GY940_06425, partial [bacterium]|nr:hypothetical protein [bacterium]